MATAEQSCYTIVADSSMESATAQESRTALEKGSDEVKLDTLQRLIAQTIQGNPQPTLLMAVIQFVMPSKNKQLKKLLHRYWEVCPKYDENGKLKQEMILVCNAIRNDLQHPNEYIRGATLRFLQKISRDAELLEPIIPTVRSCLEHRHSYVRKNAVFAVQCIYQQFEHLIPDGPELIQTFLAAESDATCKRNALVFLMTCAMPKAVEYVLQVYEQISGLDEQLQLAIIDVIRFECKTETAHRARFIRCIFELLTASSHSVKYEAATTLTALTQNPAAVKASTSCLIELVAKESDNNVKLIVLDRIDALRQRHDHVLSTVVMDILQVLSSTDMEVRRKAINIALAMVTSRNVEEVVLFLKKQLQRSLTEEYDKIADYRQLLIQSIHVCAVKFSEVAGSVVHALMEFLGESNSPAAVDAIAFVREVVEKFADLRQTIIEKLVQTFEEIKSGKVFRGGLWIVGEYCDTVDEITSVMEEIRKVLGEIPILSSEQRLLDEAGGDADEEPPKEETNGKITTKPRVLADGTYATETAYSSTAAARLEAVKSAAKPPLRTLILQGDFYTGAVLASTLTKLVLRFDLVSSDNEALNRLKAEVLLIMVSIIRVGKSKFVTPPIDEDSEERITNCIRTLADVKIMGKARTMFLDETKAASSKMLVALEKKANETKAKTKPLVIIQVDDKLLFRYFAKKGAEDVIDNDADLERATGIADTQEDLLSALSRVVQLTGYSDAIYAEALVKVHGFDILLDVLLVNQTGETLQNLCLDFATLGDLKLVERPAVHTIAPHSFQSVKATFKVSSTETGVIFGNILWEGANMSESCVVLNDIHIDIMDYIKPAYCNEAQFRSMWTEFEWENRVNVTTTITDLRAYLAHTMKSTNMACLTPDGAMSGDCDFLSANLYARSLFGEDALANLSIEKTENGSISGHVRIRSKTQGIALSLGDRITLAQKDAKVPAS